MKGIYKITSPTNKIYIGQSNNIESRFIDYKYLDCKNQPKVYNSLKKYGSNNHQFNVIHELPEDISQEVMNNYEILYMTQYRECGIELMNIKEGGSRGKHSKETRSKISNALKGKPLSDEHKQKLSDAKKGNKNRLGSKLSESHIEKMRQSHLGKPLSDEHKKKMSDSLKNRKHSEETLNKISNANKGKKRSEESKLKMSLAKIGKKLSEETKKKMSKPKNKNKTLNSNI